MTLVLMGLRGSGKSTLGVEIARRLGVTFIDLDDRTPGVLGEATVRDALVNHGEHAFRDAERTALEAALRERPGVLALGGGTPTADGAQELLCSAQSRGAIRLVYLRASGATLRARLADADNRDRPPLVGDDPVGEIATVLAARDGLYRELADETIETDGLTPDEVIERLAS